MSSKEKMERLKAEYLKRPEDERIKLAQGFLIVRASGITNMMSRPGIIAAAQLLYVPEFAEFIKNRDNHALFLTYYRELVGKHEAGGNE